MCITWGISWSRKCPIARDVAAAEAGSGWVDDGGGGSGTGGSSD